MIPLLVLFTIAALIAGAVVFTEMGGHPHRWKRAAVATFGGAGLALVVAFVAGRAGNAFGWTASDVDNSFWLLVGAGIAFALAAVCIYRIVEGEPEEERVRGAVKLMRGAGAVFCVVLGLLGATVYFALWSCASTLSHDHF